MALLFKNKEKEHLNEIELERNVGASPKALLLIEAAPLKGMTHYQNLGIDRHLYHPEKIHAVPSFSYSEKTGCPVNGMHLRLFLGLE